MTEALARLEHFRVYTLESPMGEKKMGMWVQTCPRYTRATQTHTHTHTHKHTHPSKIERVRARMCVRMPARAGRFQPRFQSLSSLPPAPPPVRVCVCVCVCVRVCVCVCVPVYTYINAHTHTHIHTHTHTHTHTPRTHTHARTIHSSMPPSYWPLRPSPPRPAHRAALFRSEGP